MDSATVVLHLYHEIHDDQVHLEMSVVGTNLSLNLVLSEPFIDGVAAILTRANI